MSSTNAYRVDRVHIYIHIIAFTVNSKGGQKKVPKCKCVTVININPNCSFTNTLSTRLYLSKVELHPI